jgi:ABC-2 type transport system ATP-binding protein
MPDFIVEARNISKTYGQHRALNDVSLTVPKGSIYGLLGPNGAGKTTFIRILTQIIGPDSGEILLGGKALQRNDIARIGYMPEERGLYRKMKVGEQVMYFAGLKGLTGKKAVDELRYWFRVFHIEDWWNKKVEELSKGMQQKIQFITTVVHRPELIILDEPFSGFDPVNSAIIKEEILKLKENGSTIILSTHRMESVEELCDNFSLINRSQKIIEGSVNEVRHQFKEYSFELILSYVNGDLSISQNADMQVEKTEKLKDGTHYIRFKVAPEINTNKVLSALMAYGQIVSFKEILPSINDIFIQLVQEKRIENE